MLRRRLSVHRNAVNVGAQVVVGTPKTHAERTVVFPKFLIEPSVATRSAKGRDGVMFPNRFGHYATPPGVSTWFSGAVARCMKADDKFPRVTVHDLRHPAASLAISAAANVKVVQRMLWHASAMTVDVYSDLSPTIWTPWQTPTTLTVPKMCPLVVAAELTSGGW